MNFFSFSTRENLSLVIQYTQLSDCLKLPFAFQFIIKKCIFSTFPYPRCSQGAQTSHCHKWFTSAGRTNPSPKSLRIIHIPVAKQLLKILFFKNHSGETRDLYLHCRLLASFCLYCLTFLLLSLHARQGI